MIRNTFLRTLASAAVCFLLYIFLGCLGETFTDEIAKIIAVYSFVMFLIYDVVGEKKLIGVIKAYAGVGVLVLAFTLGNFGIEILFQGINSGKNIFACALYGMAFHYFFVDFIILLCFMNKSNRGYSFLIPFVSIIVSYVISLVMSFVCLIAGGISIIFYAPVIAYAIMTLRALFAPRTENTIAEVIDPNYDPTSYNISCALKKVDLFKNYQWFYGVSDPKHKDHGYSISGYNAKYKIKDNCIIVTGKYTEHEYIPKGEFKDFKTFPGILDVYDIISKEIEDAVAEATGGQKKYWVSIDLELERDL